MAHKGKYDLWFLVIKSNTEEFHYILMVEVFHDDCFLQKLFNGKDLLVVITYRLNINGGWLPNASSISMIRNIGHMNRAPMVNIKILIKCRYLYTVYMKVQTKQQRCL